MSNGILAALAARGACPPGAGSLAAAHRVGRRGCLIAVLGVLLAACSPPGPGGSAGEQERRLAIGLLPDEEPERQRRKYAPLAEAIRNRTGFEVVLVTPRDYAALARMFSARQVDVAYFGGYTFVRALERDGAVPLVMRDIDANFTSYVLVRDDSSARGLGDLAGARFSFGSRLSTSGHIMPRYFFDAEGIVPESYFSELSYSGAHDRTIQRIVDGEVDAGVVNSQIAREWMSREGSRESVLRVIWQSPSYVDYVWAVQPSMTEKTRRAIKEVFLTLSREDDGHGRFLDAVGAAFFVPAHSTDFVQLTAAAQAVESDIATSH